MVVVFQKQKFKLVLTEHARERMTLRAITMEILIDVVENGMAIKKKEENKFWVYKSIAGRDDNMVCLLLAIEDPNQVVINTLINWTPHQ